MGFVAIVGNKVLYRCGQHVGMIKYCVGGGQHVGMIFLFSDFLLHYCT